MSFVFPPPLQPGDRIAVVAPSSPFPRAELWRGLAWLGDRYEIVARTSLLCRTGFLAGDDAARARALTEAMTAPGVKAVVIARGGYGAMRIVDRLPWDELVRAPRWIVGFSDVTALHARATALGIASVHAPNVTGLAAHDPWTRACWLRALERPRARIVWTDLHVVRSGHAEGPLVGGNLALVEAMAAAGEWHPPAGAVLALEDVSERPYRLDRMLTSLRLGGHLARIAGIILGDFARCDPGPDGVLASEVLEERTRDLGIPVVAGAPFGHGARNDAITLGAVARIDGGGVVIG
ncbi:MAG: S66 peptidase family protein [Polyangiaceae bacterium]